MMKLLTVLCVVGYASADISGTAYVRDLLLESTIRGYEKSDATNDFICEPGNTGADCSLLKCPYSASFVAGKSDDWLYSASNARPQETTGSSSTLNTATSVVSNSFDNHHVYKECGGRGVCDRSTGQCKCFESFTGEGCRRSTCPNDCSGHGVCRTDTLAFWAYQGYLGNQVAEFADSSTWGARWNWDKYAQCKCDRGYEGYDCSMRQCAFGDDPETECADELAYDQQTVSVSCTDVTACHFSLQFQDQLGGEFSTRVVIMDQGSSDSNAHTVQTALEALPNFAIPSVEVDMVSTPTATAGSGTYSFTVSFVDDATTNEQHLLTVNDRQHDGSCTSGAQPKFTNVVSASSVTRETATDDMKEAVECGGRGLCDRTSGLCSCFDGYYGESCSEVTTYI